MENPRDLTKKRAIQLLKSGCLEEEVHGKHPSLCTLFIVDNAGVRREIGYLVCKRCSTLLTPGGGSGSLSRHVSTTCPAIRAEPTLEKGQKTLEDCRPRALTKQQADEIENVVVNYFVRSGLPFAHVEKKEFREFLIGIITTMQPKCPIASVNSAIPSRRVVRDRVMDVFRELRMACRDEVLPFFEKKEAAVIVDYGRHLNDYLSVYCSFVDQEFRLQVVPLGFVHAPGGKDAEEVERTARLIFSTLERVGISEDIARQAVLVADGATAMAKCGNQHFRKYVRCGAHALNNLGLHVLQPYSHQRPLFTQDELTRLADVEKTLKAAIAVSSAVHRQKALRQVLPRLPNKGVETRWLSYCEVASDILSLLDLLVMHRRKGTDEFNRNLELVVQNRLHLVALVDVWTPLKKPVVSMQSDERLSLQSVIPNLLRIKKFFVHMENGGINEIAHLLGKSGRLALQHTWTIAVEDYHEAATFLSPKHKLTEGLQQGKALVDRFLGTDETSAAPPPKRRRSHSPDLLSDEETYDSGELSVYSALPPHASLPEDFWNAQKTAFPRLHQCAKRIFCVIPTEAACERAFSRAARIIGKFRLSLEADCVEGILLSCELSHRYQLSLSS